LSRLDSFIRRLEAQRACLDHVVGLIAGRDGPALEIGLGNGRTYDHLRARLGDRALYAFDRELKAHPDCVPPAEFLILGDVRDGFRLASVRIGRPAVLAHCDFGSGDRAATAALAAWLGPALKPLLAPGAIVLSDQALDGFRPLPLPAGVAEGRYFLYRHGDGG